MFTIIGGDGREYGPVTAEQIRGWIKAGRANLDTKARAEGATEWQRLSDFAEFAPPSRTTAARGATAVGRIQFYRARPQRPPSSRIPPSRDRGSRLMARIIDWMLEILCAIPGGIVLGTEILKLAMEAAQGKEPDFFPARSPARDARGRAHARDGPRAPRAASVDDHRARPDRRENASWASAW